jgi:hypothetical protein
MMPNKTTQSVANVPQTCFVIMPFGEKPDDEEQAINFDVVYDYIIREVAESIGLKVIRADKIQTPGWIHGDMLAHILSDDVAIVDITSLNPNVFYELGIRHALRKSVTIMIRKKGTKNPFNIQGMRTIEYDLDIKSATKAKKEIEQFIRNGLAKQSNDSMVYQVFPGLRVSFTKRRS